MKLDCILLVDDDLATNFINQRIIKAAGFNVNVETCASGVAALDYLLEDSSKPQPGIILLDINMPEMDGWEFIDQFEKIPEEKRKDIVLAMLTTSINPDDESKAREKGIVTNFISKPLRKEHLESLVNDYLAN